MEEPCNSVEPRLSGQSAGFDGPPPPLTLMITRDEKAGGGYGLAVCDESIGACGGKRRFVAVASVDSQGPAISAGMRVEHVGWRITHVDGMEVDADSYAAELEKTRHPGYTFQMTIRSPVTGEITFTDPSDKSTFRVHVDVRDICVQMGRDEDGSRRIELSVPEPMMLRAGPEEISRLSTRMVEILQEMGSVRKQLCAEDRQKLEQEEQAAAALDKTAENMEMECVVCKDSMRALVLFPCHHLATCHKCTVMVRRCNKCPICRAEIHDAIERSEVNQEETDIFIS